MQDPSFLRPRLLNRGIPTMAAFAGAALLLILPEAADAGPAPRAGDDQRATETVKVSDSSKSSHTRRVKVVNGKTVIDEETVNGKRVTPGKRTHPKGQPVQGGQPDLDRMLDELINDMGKDLPPEAIQELRRAAKDGVGGSTSSHSRRVVVKNGKTIVDEETVNGRPVRGGPSGAKGTGGSQGPLLKDLLRDVEREVSSDTQRKKSSNSQDKVSKRAPKKAATAKTQPLRRVERSKKAPALKRVKSSGK